MEKNRKEVFLWSIVWNGIQWGDEGAGRCVLGRADTAKL